MSSISLSSYPTDSLKRLKQQINDELRSRSGECPGARRIARIHSLEPTFFENELTEAKSTREFNQEYQLSLPKINGFDPESLEPYLLSLINQDWKDLYPRDSDNGEYYVYAHVDPRHKVFLTNEDGGGNYGGRPFYIGKGIGNRAFDLKRNQGHGKILRDIIKNNTFPIGGVVKIIFSALSEQKALELESKLIYFFGVRYNRHKKGWLVNLTEPVIPDFASHMKIIPSYEPKEITHTVDNKKQEKETNNDINLTSKTYTEEEVKDIVNKAIRKRMARIKSPPATPA